MALDRGADGDQLRDADRLGVEAAASAARVVAADAVIAAGRADLCALARPHLSDPYLTLNAAVKYAYNEPAWPPQYFAVKPRRT